MNWYEYYKWKSRNFGLSTNWSTFNSQQTTNVLLTQMKIANNVAWVEGCKSKIVNTSKRRFMTFQGCPIARLYVKWGDKPVRNGSILYSTEPHQSIEQTCKHQFYDAVCSSFCTIQAFMWGFIIAKIGNLAC